MSGIPRMSRAFETLRNLVEATSLTTGQAFFDALVVNLPRAVGGTHALVGELSGPNQRQTHTLAVCWNGTLGENFVYALDGTPCEVVLSKGELAYYPSGVARMFPRDQALTRLGVEAYMGTPLRAADGSYLGMLAVLHDCPLDESTEPASILRIFADRAAAELQRRRDEERLRLLQLQLFRTQKFEALGRLAGTLVHDFNNLLTAINGGCDLILLDEVSPSVHQSVSEISATAQKGTQVIRQLLAFAMRQPTTAHVVVVQDVLNALRPVMRQVLGLSIRSQLEFEDRPLRILIDPSQLEQVLVNLIVNARDAIHKDGLVQVRAELRHLDLQDAQLVGLAAAGAYVCLQVADNGCGMSPDVLRRACEPFFTTKGPEVGSGLGLASCHGIVAQAGGSLIIESELDHGTNVKLYIPLHDAACPN